MNKLLILIGVMLLIVLLIFIMTVWPSRNNVVEDQSDIALPVSVSPTVTPPTNVGGQHIPTLSVKDGGRIPVRNFLEDSGVAQLDDDFYSIATVGDSEGEYSSIYYYTDDGGVIVLLTREPLSVARLLAEEELRARFQLPDDQLCELEILVQTNRYVNIDYAGRNLGLSFCPGSVSFENAI